MIDSGAGRDLPVRKGIVPLAGLGTRLLPVTKAIPKGMLPVIDKPVIQHIVEEAAATGLTDVVLVIGGDQDAFSSYFSRAGELEQVLAERGQHDVIAELRASTCDISVSFRVQDTPLGLGDAVLRCADYIGDEPFAILFGDNVLSPGSDLLSRMIAARSKYGGTILALAEIPPDEASSRGVVAFQPTPDPSVVRITDLVEKPEPSAAPSSLIMIGRCVCDPAVFAVLRGTVPGHGGEIQLSDALRQLASTDEAAGGGVHGLRFNGRRFDTGNRLDYLRATVELGCTRPDLAPQFLPWLRQYVGSIG